MKRNESSFFVVSLSSYGHTTIGSYGHTIMWSYDPMSIWSWDDMIIWSCDQMIIWSYHRVIIPACEPCLPQRRRRRWRRSLQWGWSRQGQRRHRVLSRRHPLDAQTRMTKLERTWYPDPRAGKLETLVEISRNESPEPNGLSQNGYGIIWSYDHLSCDHMLALS